MKTSESIKAISVALVAFEAEVETIAKGAENPFFHSKYADLPSILEAIKNPLEKHGLAVVQGAISTEAGLQVETRIIHDSGEWIETTTPIGVAKPDPQGYGSAITYGRRYSLQAALNLSADDDDGNKASSPASQPTNRKPAPTRPQQTSPDKAKAIQEIKDICEIISMGDEGKVAIILKEWSVFTGTKDKKEHCVIDYIELEAASDKWVANIHRNAMKAKERWDKSGLGGDDNVPLGDGPESATEQDNLPF